jgi:hypothetical protein
MKILQPPLLRLPPRRQSSQNPLLSPRLPSKRDPSPPFKKKIKALLKVLSARKRVKEAAAEAEAELEVAVEVAVREEKAAKEEKAAREEKAVREEKAAKASVVDAVAEVAVAVVPESKVRKDPELRVVKAVAVEEDPQEPKAVPRVKKMLPMFQERKRSTTRARLTISKERKESNGTHLTERTALAEAEASTRVATAGVTLAPLKTRLEREKRFLRLKLIRLSLLKRRRLKMFPLNKLPPLKLSKKKRSNQLRTI